MITTDTAPKRIPDFHRRCPRCGAEWVTTDMLDAAGENTP